jgi:hypothetical protein
MANPKAGSPGSGTPPFGAGATGGASEVSRDLLVEHLAEGGPVVLVIEDMHWADRSSRDLLA